MHLLLWIFIGLVAGWLAGKSLDGEGYGPSMDIVMGIAGALIGGSVMRGLGFTGYGGSSLAALVAITCAVLFTALTGLTNGRRIHIRAL